MSGRLAGAFLACVALGAGGCEAPSGTAEEQARSPRPCPPAGESVPEDKTLNARVLVSERAADAVQLARRYGCRLRVVIRDGHVAATGTPANRVIDVEVRNGRVTREPPFRASRASLRSRGWRAVR